VLVSRRGRAGFDHLVLAGGHARRSLLIGLYIGVAIAAAVLASPAVPVHREVLVDER